MISLVVHNRTRLDLLSIKTFRWDQRLQIQNFFMAIKQVPDGDNIESTV